MKSTLVSAAILALATSLAAPAEGRVVRLVVEHRSPFAGGKSFGEVGAFERLDGTVHMEVDPSDPLNALIVNLDKAPRNSKGLVEFSAPFYIIKPVNPALGNRKIFYGVNNRGNLTETTHHSFPSPDLSLSGASPEAGDGLIFRLGYTYVDAGWAGDITTVPPRLGANLPIAMQRDGRAIVAPIRIEYRVAPGTGTQFTVTLKGNTQFRTYETASTDTSRSSLTVRSSRNGPRRPIASDRWAFGRCAEGKASLVPTTTDLCLFDGFQPHQIYDWIYPAKNPWVMGLGYAVVRDLASFLRYESRDDAGVPNPLAASTTSTGIRRAYGFGSSSTGMFFRDWLYLGFNEDERHRKVFDAVRLLIPGTHRLFANVEFADPNVFSGQDQHTDFLSHSLAPLTYAVTTDPITKVRDGILKRSATDPLVMQVDSANEFWQMGASLNVHDGRGQPVTVPENVRLYFAASHAHTGATGLAFVPTTTGQCEYVTNGLRSEDIMLRALLVALDDWADRGIPPPESRYPDVRNGTLVSVAEAAKLFPSIPGVRFPTVQNDVTRLDYGPKFGSLGGWLTTLPPVRGTSYQQFVPKPDQDGIDLGGVRTIEMLVPVGTNTGWNLRGSSGTELCGLSGSFFPFAKTKAERQKTGDPRLSLEERYRDHSGFVRAVQDAASRLVKERFLLEEDTQRLVNIAEASSILR